MWNLNKLLFCPDVCRASYSYSGPGTAGRGTARPGKARQGSSGLIFKSQNN